MRKTSPAKKPLAKKPAIKKPTKVAPVSEQTVAFPQADISSRDEAISALMHALNKPERRVIAHADDSQLLKSPSTVTELAFPLNMK